MCLLCNFFFRFKEGGLDLWPPTKAGFQRNATHATQATQAPKNSQRKKIELVLFRTQATQAQTNQDAMLVKFRNCFSACLLIKCVAADVEGLHVDMTVQDYVFHLLFTVY